MQKSFKIFVCSFIVTLFSFFAKGQTVHPMVYAGYQYQNQSFGEIGGRLLLLNNDDILYRFSASALMGQAGGKFAIMPKVQADILFNFKKESDIYHSLYFLAGAESTNKYIAPKIGISILGIIDITGGYAFNYGNKLINGKELKGVNLGFSVNIPLVMLKK